MFGKDIERLLGMEELWKSRTKPISLNYESLLKASKNVKLSSNDDNSIEFDHNPWTLEQNFRIFIDRY